ncbi:hypothetical protein [Bacteroides sp.]|uniref:hypothetical protein n=1 Tax=Bacteroides sp. TaxID=29523 RepID=UPI00260E3055|nr:hypothetical protein [Bacteroides sp.]MDD3039541.1 hypothetical protein [Bacteroides sp.]
MSYVRHGREVTAEYFLTAKPPEKSQFVGWHFKFYNRLVGFITNPSITEADKITVVTHMMPFFGIQCETVPDAIDIIDSINFMLNVPRVV